MSIQLQVGQEHMFDEQALMQVRLDNAIDAMYGALQTDTMEVSLHSDAPAEDFALQEQKAWLYRDDRKIATYCVKKNTRQGAERFRLSCRTNLEFLEGEFMGGMYENENPETLLYHILGDFTFVLDGTIATRSLTGYIPICTRAQALRQVAFALGAVVSVNADGMFRFQALDPKNCVQIGPERILSQTTLVTQPHYTRVELVAHSYEPSADWEVLYDGKDLNNETITLTFREPNCEYSISDGSIVDSGPNFVTIDTNGYMTVKVRPYKHKTAYHTRVGENAQNSGFSQVLSVREYTLVCPENVEQILDWMYERAQMRQKLTCKILVDGELTGQLVSLPTSWGTRFTGYITRMKSTLTATGQLAEVTILGTEEKEEA